MDHTVRCQLKLSHSYITWLFTAKLIKRISHRRRHGVFSLKTDLPQSSFGNSSKVGTLVKRGPKCSFQTFLFDYGKLKGQHCLALWFSEVSSFELPIRSLSTSLKQLLSQIHLGFEDCLYPHPHLEVGKYMCFSLLFKFHNLK